MWWSQVILLKDIPGTGSKGELARVNNGYLRNYLMPQQLAVPATAGILQCASYCQPPLHHISTSAKPSALSMPTAAAVLHPFRTSSCICKSTPQDRVATSNRRQIQKKDEAEQRAAMEVKSKAQAMATALATIGKFVIRKKVSGTFYAKA